ncbi:MAG TPA: host-nuclease inhibitor Gam family protein [Candidatus Paceibacterota bacterium]|jgi:phage host-nuclease inhibitor protein Gam
MAKRPSTGASSLPRVRQVRTNEHIAALVGQIGTLERARDDELEPRLARIAALEKELAGERAQVAIIEQRFSRVIIPRANKVLGAATERQGELTSDAQTVDLGTGQIRWRRSTVALRVEDEEAVLASLKRARQARHFIRYIPQIDLAALRQRPEIYMKLSGLAPERATRFSILPEGLGTRLVTVLGSSTWAYEPA